MICRKCKAEIPDNSIRCPECGVKVNMFCPECGELNMFGLKKCQKCGKELIITCPACGASNLADALSCRKCRYPFVKEREQIENPVQAEQQNAVNVQPVKEEQIETLPEIKSDIFEQTQEAASEEIEAEISREIPDKRAVNEAETEIQTENAEIQEHMHSAGFTAKELPESSREEQNLSQVKIHYDAVIKAAELLSNPGKQKHIIGISGEEGSGKSIVLKQISGLLLDKGFLTLSGRCTPLVQITSFGFFQDAFLRLMGFPPYTKSMDSFIKDFKKSSFYKVFSFLNGHELSAFLNIFYPSKKDSFDNILKNKMQMFSILEKIIGKFSADKTLIIAIDNFDLLDGASYDFIFDMIKKGMFRGRIKLLAAYSGTKDMKSYFELSSDEENMFETIAVNKFNEAELLDAAEKCIGIRLEQILDKNTIDELIINADGSAVKMEQETALLFDTGYVQLQEQGIVLDNSRKPSKELQSLEDIIKLRIKMLTEPVKSVLFTAAILGFRFAPGILYSAVPMQLQNAEENLNFLIKNLFIQSSDNYTCEFKSLTIWKLIYQEAKADAQYQENAKRLYMTLRQLILSNSLQKLVSAASVLSETEEYLIWQNAASIAAGLGDTNLYVIALKQSLKLIEHQDITNIEEQKLKMYEEMGKLLCVKSPQEASAYLSNALDTYIKQSDVCKIIDVSSYFAKSCHLSGSSFGAAEAVDAALEAIGAPSESVSALEIALIKTRKLNALLNIGNTGQVLNLIEEEILPDIDKNLKSEQLDAEMHNILKDAMLNAKIVQAKAHALSGNCGAAGSVLAELYSAIDKYNYKTDYYKLQADLTSAFTKTVSGCIKESNKILNGIALEYNMEKADAVFSVYWNLINILNRLFLLEYDNLKEDLFALASSANNINEHFIKNAAKLILGYITKLEGNPEKAGQIYSEESMYFAKEKSAIGALSAWLLTVQKDIEEAKLDSAFETAVKALEIAQGAKINNYIFTIYFQKYIADIYTQKSDFTSAKMYLEKAAALAKKLNLRYQLTELYISYAQYIQDFMRETGSVTKENAAAANNIYQKTAAMSKELEIDNLTDIINTEYVNFKTFCRMNGIEA